MKTVAQSCRVSLIALAGCALVVGVAAASDSNTPSPQATPSANTIKATDSTEGVPAPTPKEKPPAGDSRGGTAVSSQIAEIVKMTEAGVGITVIQAQVERSATAYPLGADEIIYLHNHGVPPEIITAFIRRGSELRAQAEQAARESQNGPAQAAPSAPSPAPANIQPPAYAYPAQPEYPVYPYTYPNYAYLDYPGYNYYSYWPSFGWSFGFYPGRFAGYHHRYPGHFYGPVHPYPRSFVASGRSPWMSPVRSGYGPPGHYGSGVRTGVGGHFGGGFSGSRGHR
jgi:hypothetical protein